MKTPRFKNPFSRLTASSGVESEYPFFLLYVRCLATSAISRLQLFSITAQKDVFRHIASYMKRISILTEKWRYGQADACEAVSRKAPTKAFKEFLLRMAQSIRAGEPIQDFLSREYTNFMTIHPEQRERSLQRLRHLADAYSAVFTSGVFLAVISILIVTMLPFSALLPMLMIVAASIMAGLNMVAVIMFKAAKPDDVLISEKTKPRTRRILELFAVSSIAAAALLLLATQSYGSNISLLAASLPILAAGVAGKLYVKTVKKREEAYQAFLRNLLSYLSGGVPVLLALKNILDVKYGALTKPIKNLYAKLVLRIDPQIAWRAFEIETGSELIRRLDATLLDTVYKGGDIAETGKLVNQLYTAFMAIRRRRYQVVSYFQGIITPLHAAMCALMGMISAFFKLLFQYASMVSTIVTFMYVPPIEFIDLYLIFLIVTFSISNAMALYFIEGDSRYSFLFYLGLLLASGAAGFTAAHYLTTEYLSKIQV